MKLHDLPFDRIKSGIKTLELRLYDEKRQQLNPGDTIVFTKTSNPQETITAAIDELLLYPSFHALLDAIDLALLGYTQSDRPWLESSLYDIYTRENEALYGVVGIRIHLI